MIGTHGAAKILENAAAVREWKVAVRRVRRGGLATIDEVQSGGFLFEKLANIN
jgi:hypothetical protein